MRWIIKIAADKQYQLLMQIEKMLLISCRWALANGRKIHATSQVIDCYSRYLKDYEQHFKQDDCVEIDAFKKQLLQYRQDGVPDGWRKDWCL